MLRLGRRIRRLVRGFLTESIDRDVVKRASLEAFFGVFRQLCRNVFEVFRAGLNWLQILGTFYRTAERP